MNMRIIESTYSIIQEFLKDLKDYTENCKIQPWGITPEIARWCNKYGSAELVKFLQKFGTINKYTVAQIKEENYLKNIVNQFSSLFKNNNIRLIKNNKSTFNVISNIRNNIIIIVNTIKFLDIKKEYLFDD